MSILMLRSLARTSLQSSPLGCLRTYSCELTPGIDIYFARGGVLCLQHTNLGNGNSEIEDCTQDWTFRSEEFDYVHIRWLLGSIQDWDALMHQAYRVLRPGAYFEILEPSAIITSDDGSVTETSALGQWGKFFINGGKQIGRSFTVVEDETQRKSMEVAGFVDIQEFNYKVSL